MRLKSSVMEENLSSITTTVQGGMCGEARRAARSRSLAWERLARFVTILRILEPPAAAHSAMAQFSRHLLLTGIPLNYLSRWLGHSNIQTTLVYLELVPDPSGTLAAIP